MGSLPLSALDVKDFDPTKEELLHCKILEQIQEQLSRMCIQVRLFMLQSINNLLAPLLESIIDLAQPSVSDTLAAKVRNIKHLIFWSHKVKLWKKALGATVMASTSTIVVNLDRMKAMQLKQNNEMDVKGT